MATRRAGLGLGRGGARLSRRSPPDGRRGAGKMLQVLVLKVSEREAPGRAVHHLPCRGHPVGTRAKGFRMGSSWTLHINNGKSLFRGAPCSIGDVLNKVTRCFSEIQIELGVLYSEPRGEGRSLTPSPTHLVRDPRRVSHRPLRPASAVCRPVPLPGCGSSPAGPHPRWTGNSESCRLWPH